VAHTNMHSKNRTTPSKASHTFISKLTLEIKINPVNSFYTYADHKLTNSGTGVRSFDANGNSTDIPAVGTLAYDERNRLSSGAQVWGTKPNQFLVTDSYLFNVRAGCLPIIPKTPQPGGIQGESIPEKPFLSCASKCQIAAVVACSLASLIPTDWPLTPTGACYIGFIIACEKGCVKPTRCPK
jgi:hypothetical protein